MKPLEIPTCKGKGAHRGCRGRGGGRGRAKEEVGKLKENRLQKIHKELGAHKLLMAVAL